MWSFPVVLCLFDKPRFKDLKLPEVVHQVLFCEVMCGSAGAAS
jgi:hypothetical protein